MKVSLNFFFIFLLLSSTLLIGSVSATGFEYDNIYLPNIIKEVDYIKQGGDNIFGNYLFNGGWESGGLSIIGGDIFAQIGHFSNITYLNITRQELTVTDNLIVGGNASASYFKGDGSLLTGNIGAWNVSGTNLFPKDLDYNVGIGTATPESKLHIIASESAARVKVDSSATGGSNTPGFHIESESSFKGGIFYFEATDTIQIWNEDAAKIIINNAGNVGIGTSSPKYKLDVNGNVSLNNTLYVNSNKRVGIGIALPSHLLHVNGISQLSNVLISDIKDLDGNENLWIYANISDAYNRKGFIGIRNDGLLQVGIEFKENNFGSSGENILFRTGEGVEQVRIDENGFVGIGTSTPQQELNVIGDLNVTGLTTTGIINSTTPNVLNYFEGNLSVNDINVRSEGSLTFGLSPNFTAKMSAYDYSVPPFGSRIGVIVDSDLGADYSKPNGTVYVTSIQEDDSPLSTAILNAINGVGWGIGISKWSNNYSISPNRGLLHNNIGKLEIRNQENQRNEINGTNITIGFYDEMIYNSFFDILGLQNETDVIVIEDGFSANPYRTHFYYDVDFSNIYQTNGNSTINLIHGSMGYNSDDFLTVPISASKTWTNVTGLIGGELNNGFDFINSTMICQFDGIYQVRHTESYTDGVGNEYNFAVAINNVVENMTKSHSLINNANDVAGASGMWEIYCNEGDMINLQVLNQQTASDVNLHQATVLVNRVGN